MGAINSTLQCTEQQNNNNKKKTWLPTIERKGFKRKREREKNQSELIIKNGPEINGSLFLITIMTCWALSLSLVGRLIISAGYINFIRLLIELFLTGFHSKKKKREGRWALLLNSSRLSNKFSRWLRGSFFFFFKEKRNDRHKIRPQSTGFISSSWLFYFFFPSVSQMVISSSCVIDIITIPWFSGWSCCSFWLAIREEEISRPSCRLLWRRQSPASAHFLFFSPRKEARGERGYLWYKLSIDRYRPWSLPYPGWSAGGILSVSTTTQLNTRLPSITGACTTAAAQQHLDQERKHARLFVLLFDGSPVSDDYQSRMYHTDL